MEIQKTQNLTNLFRSKRGALDVIGNVAYSLDSQYAEKMEQRLRKVK